MDFDHPAVLVGLGALLGFLSSLGGQVLNRYWSRGDRREDREHREAAARRAEIDRRSDAAAVEAVDELAEVVEAFRGRSRHGDYPEADDLDPHLRRLERCLLFIRDREAQERMSLAVGLMHQVSTIEQLGGGLPSQIAYVLTRAVRETLSATLQGLPLPPVPAKVVEYEAEVEDHYALIREMEERDRPGRARG